MPPLTGHAIVGRRYWRTLWFAAWMFTRVVWWEIVLRRMIGERRIAPGRARRLQRWAGEFRALAVRMGGVMIKLGQFVSTRLDLLPPEVIEVLAALQDEVPSVPFEDIRAILLAELGPLEDHFAAFTPTPVAAASLGQAHKARLLDQTQVVVKVQRPGIGALVHTDLSALRVVSGWAMRIRFIRRRANVPALLDEFSATLWEELDYTREAEHAATFAAMFTANPGIYIPRQYPECSTTRVLTLEDVSAIKITDYDALAAAGIDRRDVARRLVTTYLWMVFDQRYFHADPHAGNLFIYPLPEEAPASVGQHTDGQPLFGRPFYLIFVDFGMVGRLTPEVVHGLSETLIALATRNPGRLVRSYQELGILLPNADLARIEEAAQAAFDRVWGLNLAEISGMHTGEMLELGREFKDLLFELPFQIPLDFLLFGRAIGMLVGLCTGIDPAFDPWQEVYPFVRTLLADNDELPPLPAAPTLRDLLNPDMARALLSRRSAEWAFAFGIDMVRRMAQLPALTEDVLRRAERGDLTVRVDTSDRLARQFAGVEHAVQRLSYAVLCAGLTVGSAILYSAGETTLSAAGFALAGLTFLRVMFFGGGR